MDDKSRTLFFLAVVFLETTRGQERRCDVPADVVFLMDASDSIKDTEWEQEKEFVSVLIDNLEVDRYAIHVGVIVYSTEIGQIIDLQPFKTKNQLKTLLQQAVQINQGTDTAKAISKMIEMSDNQGRFEAGAKQIAVIITDGRSTDVSATIREARRARLQHKIEMIALGVGSETFLEEMMEITGHENTNRLFQVKDFGQLRDVVVQLQDLICEIIPTTTTAEPVTSTTTTTIQPLTSPNVSPIPCARPADVVFLIDGSYSISPSDWVKGKQFVTYIINSVDVGVESVHVGIIVYSSDIGDVVPLQPFKSKSELKTAALGLTQPPIGRTNTALGLQRVREMIFSQGRRDVPHIAIVITDGLSSSPSETYDQATAAKNEGVVIIVVGVGDRVLRQEVEDMASSRTSLFSATDYKTLLGMVELLRNNICTVIKEVTTATPSASTQTVPSTRPPVPELCRECLVEGGVGFNPLPTDCEKYVLCLPQGDTYQPHVKSCPFGMFWSSVSVSCLDARYVDCPSDKCRSLADSATYPSGSSSCRSYFSCANSRSTPTCCEAGFRYVSGAGCSPDPSCLDSCPLNVTIYNQGACRFRADPASYYSYLEVIPGQGHRRRSCPPGQVYSQSKCSCTFSARDVIPLIACTAAVNLTFDGSFQDHAFLSHPIDVHRVSLTNSGTAYFDGGSSLTLPATASKDMGDNLVIKIKYRKKPEELPGQQIWNNHGTWGFQTWFNNASNHGNAHSVVVGKSELTQPDFGLPTGAEVQPLEVITVSKNGTVFRDPRYDMKIDESWPKVSQSAVEIIQLGHLGTLTAPTIENGVIYVPNGKQKLLIQDSVGGASGNVRPGWRVVSVDVDGQTGKVEETGSGSVPVDIQKKYGFDLRPPGLERWFILAPGSVVLQQGEGPIPDEVLNRYAGFTPGKMVKVFERGDAVERWQVSKPDGTQLEEGPGAMPQSIISSHQLDKVIFPTQRTTTWSVVASDGQLLESGTGDIPSQLVQKYISSPSVTVVTSTSHDGREPHWQISRPSGVKVMEGRGSLPQGISRYIKGDLFLPQISSINKWTVTLPDGTVETGTGQIPQEILNLFQQVKRQTGKVTETGSQVINRWTVTLPDGTVRSGEGQLPEDIKAMMDSQGSRLEKQWQVTLPDGTVKSGYGDMPADMQAMLGGQGQGPAPRLRTGESYRRRERAVTGDAKTMDLLSNCGVTPSVAPSLHLFASGRDVTLNLVTSQAPSGVSLSLPVNDGVNDVAFIYDGSDLTGLVNGYVRKLPLTGRVETSLNPVTVGQCLSKHQSHFVGEIDQLEMYFCLP